MSYVYILLLFIAGSGFDGGDSGFRGGRGGGRGNFNDGGQSNFEGRGGFNRNAGDGNAAEGENANADRTPLGYVPTPRPVEDLFSEDQTAAQEYADVVDDDEDVVVENFTDEIARIQYVFLSVNFWDNDNICLENGKKLNFNHNCLKTSKNDPSTPGLARFKALLFLSFLMDMI